MLAKSTLRSSVLKSVSFLALASCLALPQVGCAAPQTEAATEGTSALEDGPSGQEFTSNTSASGHVTLWNSDGAAVFSGPLDSHSYEAFSDSNNRVAFRFADGSVTTVLSSQKVPGGARYRLQLNDGSVVTVNNTDGSGVAADEGAGGIRPRIAPILIIGGVAAVGLIAGSVAYYFTAKGCQDAFAAAQKICTDAGLIPEGGGCEFSYIVRYTMTPPKCVAKPVAAPAPAKAEADKR